MPGDSPVLQAPILSSTERPSKEAMPGPILPDEVTEYMAALNDYIDENPASSDLLQGVRGTVNLIPYNENPGLDFRRPSDGKIDTFASILRNRGVKVSVRKRKGHKILAACGQLRLRERG